MIHRAVVLFPDLRLWNCLQIPSLEVFQLFSWMRFSMKVLLWETTHTLPGWGEWGFGVTQKSGTISGIRRCWLMHHVRLAGCSSDTHLKNVGLYEQRCVAGLVHEIWKTDKCLLSIYFLLLPFKVLNVWNSLCRSSVSSHLTFPAKGVSVAYSFVKKVIYGLPCME